MIKAEIRNVVSLFDGCGTGYYCLQQAGILFSKYHAFEIDKNCIKVSKDRCLLAEHHGDVRNGNWANFKDVDLFLAGFPCTDLSIGKRGRAGLNGESSSLFWTAYAALKIIKPKWFIIENNASMPMSDKNIISESLGVEPIEINSSLVSAQNRKRLYWTNIPGVTIPSDKCISISDAFGFECKGAAKRNQITKRGIEAQINIRKDSKSNCVVASYSKKLNAYVTPDGEFHSMTPEQLEILQTLPAGFTRGVKESARLKMLGMGWTADVITHILSFIPND